MKKITEMNILELKGVLYDLDVQIRQIQNYAQTNIMPLLNKLIEEEKRNSNNKPTVEIKDSTLVDSPIVV
jgi:hypothetical protein